MAVWKVKERLDLEKTETAWRYMDRYGFDVIERKQVNWQSQLLTQMRARIVG